MSEYKLYFPAATYLYGTNQSYGLHKTLVLMVWLHHEKKCFRCSYDLVYFPGQKFIILIDNYSHHIIITIDIFVVPQAWRTIYTNFQMDIGEAQ